MGICWVGFRLPEASALELLNEENGLDLLLESDDIERSLDLDLDLDKAWHGAHWMLTHSAEPIAHVSSDAILGGHPIGDDMGYGPSRLLSAEGTAAVAGFLADLDVATLRSRFDPATMTAAEVYPAIWNEIWDEQDLFDSYLRPSLEALKPFYAAAASAGEGVIQMLC